MLSQGRQAALIFSVAATHNTGDIPRATCCSVPSLCYSGASRYVGAQAQHCAANKCRVAGHGVVAWKLGNGFSKGRA